MLNHDGSVAECTGDNVFMVKNKVLYTPPTYVGALKGITRDAIIHVAKQNKIAFEETVLTRHELYNADECFFTGTAAEVIPVVKIDARKIKNAKPGPVTLKLLAAFKQLTKKDGVSYKV